MCEIEAVCHDCDLALLVPTNKNFLENIEPLEISDMPALRDRIFVCGYPIGGDEISVTEGVVSRIEVQPYAHSMRFLLAVTVDAAINSGNSGGPVLTKDSTVAGIAFQAQEDAENIGHIVPPLVINQFIAGVDRFGGEYKGFPALGLTLQTLENPLLRSELGLTEDQSGVLITHTTQGGSGVGVWKEGDVLIELDGLPISNNGTINFKGMRTNVTVAVDSHFIGDKIPVKIIRDKKLVEADVELAGLSELCPTISFDKRPEYYIYLGLVFQPLSVDLLNGYFQTAVLAPSDLLYMCSGYEPSDPECTQVVVLTSVFKDNVNLGYDETAFSAVATINDQKIKNLRHLEEVIRSLKSDPEKNVVIAMSNHAKIILPNPASNKAKKVQKSILSNYGISKGKRFHSS